ncbi:Kinesin light chain 3 [Rhizophlyctis rosea]|nr:Kinesin light chain 3 [Rhizophlyctis rosea]
MLGKLSSLDEMIETSGGVSLRKDEISEVTAKSDTVPMLRLSATATGNLCLRLDELSATITAALAKSKTVATTISEALTTLESIEQWNPTTKSLLFRSGDLTTNSADTLDGTSHPDEDFVTTIGSNVHGITTSGANLISNPREVTTTYKLSSLDHQTTVTPNQSSNRLETTSSPSSAIVLPLNGVHLSFFKTFITQCGGRQALCGLTTAQICQQFVKPRTTLDQSFCDTLLTTTPLVVSTSNWFISHCWQYTFLEVVDAIHAYFRDRGLSNVVLWFDLFSLPQHIRVKVAADWLKNTFMDAISSMKNVLMVITALDKPLTLTRAWCIFELYAAISTKSEFDVALPTAQLFEIQTLKIVTSVNTRKSKATEEDDLRAIQHAIQETVGFTNLDKSIVSALELWMVRALELFAEYGERRTRESYWAAKSEVRRAAFHMVLARLCEDVEMYDKAEQIYRYNLYRFTGTLGEYHTWSVEMLLGLGSVYKGRKQYDSAVQLYVDALEGCRKALGEHHVDTLTIMANLAEVHQLMKEYAKGEELCRVGWESSKRTLGADHHLTVKMEMLLAELNCSMGNPKKAVELLLDSLPRRKGRAEGQNQPDTIATEHALAQAYKEDGEWTVAKELYQSCLDGIREHFGADHPATLEARNELGLVYIKLGNLEAARLMLEDGLHICQRTLPVDDPLTLRFMSNLALAYDSMGTGNEAEAERLYLECMEKRKRVLGVNHSETLSATYNLAVFYHQNKRHQLAEPLYQDYLYRIKMVRGDAHKDTITAAFRLGRLWYDVGRFATAASILHEYVVIAREVWGNDNPEIRDALCMIEMSRQQIA